jgi:hypothetical protein
MIPNRIWMNSMYVKIFCIFTVFSSVLLGQDPFDAIYKNYEQHNFEMVRQKISNIDQKYQSSLDYQFFTAVLNKNGEEAKEVFQSVFEKGEKELKKLAAKKLMDYYYAKGYYLNASKFQEYLVDEGNGSEVISPVQKKQHEIPEGKTVKPAASSEIYYIQVGAFSLEENARQLVKMLATQNIKARIVERKIDKKNLFCVWLEGKEDFKDTYDYANVIKEKYDLKFRIIK